MVEKKLIKINSYLFLAYLGFTLFIWSFEMVDLICYVSNLPQATVFSRILVIGGFVFTIIYTRKRIEISSIKIDIGAFIGIGLILILGGLEGVYPDKAYDTYNYHLIAQSPGFVNYFTEHFGKGNFQVWGFRLGDRLFYPFRFLLGYRLGTVLNTFVLILIYIQIFDLLKAFENCTKKNFVIKFLTSRALWALIIVSVPHILYMLGTYCVDILSVPIALEVLRRLLDSIENEQRPSDIMLYAFLNGLWFAFKMTQIVFIVPCVILYVAILLSKKKLTFKIFTLCAILAAIPCSIYLIYSYVATGNPVFPYYNTVFRSPLFSYLDFKDERWGPTTLFEKAFWLIYAIIKPEYRQSEIPEAYTLIFAIGVCGAISTLIITLYKLIKHHYILVKKEIVSLLLIVSALFWSFTTGYSRYFLVGMVLLGIMAYCFINEIAYKSKLKLLRVICIGITFIVLSQSCLIVKDYLGGRNWRWTKIEKISLINQTEYLFKDRCLIEGIKLDVDMFYITDAMYTGLAHIYSPNTYTYNAAYENSVSDIRIAEDALAEHENLLNGNVYDIRQRNLNSLEDYITCLNTHGMYIESVSSFVNNIGNNYIMIKLNNNNLENTISFSTHGISIKCKSDYERGFVKFVCGKEVEGNGDGQTEMVIVKNGEEVYRNKVDEVEINSYAIELQNISSGDIISIQFYDFNGNVVNEEDNRFFVLNPYICETE